MAKDDIELSVGQCWFILGKNPENVIAAIRGSGNDDESRVMAAERAFVNAKKIARKLQAKFHPDVNPNDPSATKKFNNVTLAIKCLGQHTEEFRSNLEILKQRVLSSNKDTIYFKES